MRRLYISIVCFVLSCALSLMLIIVTWPRESGVTTVDAAEPPEMLAEENYAEADEARDYFPGNTVYDGDYMSTEDEYDWRAYDEGSIHEAGASYLVKELDGYLAVYYCYPDGSMRRKSVTDRYIGALPPEEQARLQAGIGVTSEDELARVLESYGS